MTAPSILGKPTNLVHIQGAPVVTVTYTIVYFVLDTHSKSVVLLYLVVRLGPEALHIAREPEVNGCCAFTDVTAQSPLRLTQSKLKYGKLCSGLVQ